MHRVLHLIKEHGVKAGVAINPATPLSAIREIVEDVDLVLIMTVNPGFGGQAFIPATLRKLRELKQWREELGLEQLRVEVDGGITSVTAPLVVEAGADVLVAGNAVFGQADRKGAISEIRDSVRLA
ncbi:Ribulose-phosphate 3-epimerase [compost metagenome]